MNSRHSRRRKPQETSEAHMCALHIEHRAMPRYHRRFVCCGALFSRKLAVGAVHQEQKTRWEGGGAGAREGGPCDRQPPSRTWPTSSSKPLYCRTGPWACFQRISCSPARRRRGHRTAPPQRPAVRPHERSMDNPRPPRPTAQREGAETAGGDADGHTWSSSALSSLSMSSVWCISSSMPASWPLSLAPAARCGADARSTSLGASFGCTTCMTEKCTLAPGVPTPPSAGKSGLPSRGA